MRSSIGVFSSNTASCTKPLTNSSRDSSIPSSRAFIKNGLADENRDFLSCSFNVSSIARATVWSSIFFVLAIAFSVVDISLKLPPLRRMSSIPPRPIAANPPVINPVKAPASNAPPKALSWISSRLRSVLFCNSLNRVP